MMLLSQSHMSHDHGSQWKEIEGFRRDDITTICIDFKNNT